MSPRRDSNAAVKLPEGPPPDLDVAVEAIRASAAAAGVEVSREELRRALAGMSPRDLRDAPATYARALVAYRESGIDPDESSEDEGVSLDDFRRYEAGDAPEAINARIRELTGDSCASSS
jgi:hypothetical protein